MGKKTKQGKGRLDKFYHMAKEQGFRSRAAFKLIQLNKKYDFLSQAKCVVDLCAAPGGWLQVCSKYMPIASIKIGVDLDPIPAIKGCVTFQADITTARCMALIRKELKHFKADCVLNDGAPNVGSNWQMDAYNQIELSLYAMKIATETLRKGGWFITKVFRSRDYNALMYVANQLFTRVESNKPQSSRNTSAEIFMVCQGYKAPDSIDPRLLDPKFALEEVDADPSLAPSGEKITSLKKLLTQKRNRGGYDNDQNGVLFTQCDLLEFLEAADPHEYLATYNKFVLSTQAMAVVKDLKAPSDLKEICEDLKLCGRREMSELLKLKYKYGLAKLKQEHGDDDEPKEQKEMTPEQLEKMVDRELEQSIKRVEREKKKHAKKEREQNAKQETRKKMSVIASTALENDEELTLDKKTWEKVREIGLDNMYLHTKPVEEDPEENMDDTERKYRYLTDGGTKMAQQSDDEDDDSDVDDDVKRVNRMAEELDQQIKSNKEYKLLKTKREAKKEIKDKAMVELQRQRKMDESDDEKLDNRDLMDTAAGEDDDSENDDDLEAEREAAAAAKASKPKHIDGSSDEESEDEGEFINPLLGPSAKKSKKDDDDEWSSDDDRYDTRVVEAKEPGSKRALQSAAVKRNKPAGAATGIAGEVSDVRDFFKSDIEVVPQADHEKPRKSQKRDENDLPDGYSSMDSDDIAETRALAKKMLRKKFREEAITGSYTNAFANGDDERDLPSWFVEDEAKHNIPNYNLTKEEVDIEKEQLKEWNARPSKKVMEAKNRKKRRLQLALNKIKNKAQVIASQDISEGAKMRQIQRMYTKEKAKHKEEKTYVVNRSFNSSQGKKAGRNVKMVDSRMRADTRNQKQKNKRKGGAGKRGKK